LKAGETAIFSCFPNFPWREDFKAFAKRFGAKQEHSIGFQNSGQPILKRISKFALMFGVDILFWMVRGGGTGSAPQFYVTILNVPTNSGIGELGNIWISRWPTMGVDF